MREAGPRSAGAPRGSRTRARGPGPLPCAYPRSDRPGLRQAGLL